MRGGTFNRRCLRVARPAIRRAERAKSGFRSTPVSPTNRSSTWSTPVRVHQRRPRRLDHPDTQQIVGIVARASSMKVALFIPCYVDAFFPEVGIATLELLERFGIEVAYPLDQTCCGPPMANSGCHEEAAPTERLFVKNFAGFDYIVGPSGSCVHHVRENLTTISQTAEVTKVRARTFELVEFLPDVVKHQAFPWADFRHKVGPHNGCATLRGLREAKSTEIDEPS